MVLNTNFWILLNSLSDFINNFNLVLSCRETGGCHKKLQIHVLQLRRHRHLCEHLALHRELHQLQTPCTRKTDGGAVQAHQHGWPRSWRRRQGTGRDDEGETSKWWAVCATGNQHLATRWLALFSRQSHSTTTIKKKTQAPQAGGASWSCEASVLGPMGFPGINCQRNGCCVVMQYVFCQKSISCVRTTKNLRNVLRNLRL